MIHHNTVIAEVLPTIDALTQFQLLFTGKRVGSLQLVAGDEFFPNVPGKGLNVD